MTKQILEILMEKSFLRILFTLVFCLVKFKIELFRDLFQELNSSSVLMEINGVV